MLRFYLKAHWNVLSAADFFTVEVWGPRGLVTITGSEITRGSIIG